MKTIEELIALKLTIKTLSVKVKRIENVNKKLKKLLLAKESESDIPVKTRPSKRKIDYFDVMEDRLRNVMANGSLTASQGGHEAGES